MPKEGFRSITVSDVVYHRFNNSFISKKDELAIKGIRSLSGYISYMLEDRMTEDDALAQHAPRLKKISVSDDRVVLLDTVKNRIAEVVVQEGVLFCQLCEVDECMHVGYANALPEVGFMMKKAGVKPSSG